MAEHRVEPQLHVTVAFRPAGFAEHDAVLAEHRAGFVDEALGEVEPVPGAVPPPPPTRPVPREPLASRMRELLGEG